MILDHLDNANTYIDLHPDFAAAFALLRRTDLTSLPEGRHDLNDGDSYAWIAKGPGRTPDEASIETHDQFIDIQYVVDGVDHMGWKARTALGPANEASDPDKDLAFYDDEPTVWTDVTPGMFAIYFPGDGHLPTISDGFLHKIILKIKI
ncbi:DUF386 family protein [Pseudodesulfovibrio sp. JC047]|uniref:YhcH/YjgK/YiaL family protein n=1 Tax=Pseudodesulfovibrio sp. JC047 TaxID=2683199 RepID=UPI0013D25A1B|nr:YhcH/YjgK/YiaL family protein [Pseudodesulfovibrio sp. JC047]NDV17866.1 DUF386 family protein [Pseudodesulfovibrio sp. JC047]